MRKKILIVAPHPDDETLGCGGFIYKFRSKCDIFCLFVTNINKDKFQKEFKLRQNEIEKVKKLYRFKKIFHFNYITSELDIYPKNKIIIDFSTLFKEIKPDEVLIPSSIDVHSDHKIVNETVVSASKSFRNPYIKKIMEYETLSETNFSMKEGFKPNLFIDISKFIKKKIDTMKIYKSEIKKHPFPRSAKAIESLALMRGSQAGYTYAESFNIIFQKKN